MEAVEAVRLHVHAASHLRGLDLVRYPEKHLVPALELALPTANPGVGRGHEVEVEARDEAHHLGEALVTVTLVVAADLVAAEAGHPCLDVGDTWETGMILNPTDAWVFLG